MRTIFISLLLANLAYFAWARWVDVPPPPASEASVRLPQLKLVEELPPDQRPALGAVHPTVLNDGTECHSVGPFADVEGSVRAASLLSARGFALRQRTEQGQGSEGYWVYVTGVKTQAEADHALATLEQGGIKDGVLMPESADAGRRVSLGLFSDRTRAEKRVQAARDAGLKAEISERKLSGTVYWVDFAPPRGADANALQDVIAAGGSTHVVVQACPPGLLPVATPATGAAAAPPPAKSPGATAGAAPTGSPAKLP